MAQHPDPHGMAAVSICESLILALVDRKIITSKEVTDLLSDVITAHTEAAANSSTPEEHWAVVKIAQCMLPASVAPVKKVSGL